MAALDENGMDVSFAHAVGALSNPLRVQMIRQLVTPKPLGEIEIRAGADGAAPPLARQSIRLHLDRLLEAGLVQAQPTAADARSPVAYAVNHQMLYALSEELRGLAGLRPTVEPSVPTASTGGVAPVRASGPRLVLAKGVGEGRAFPLHAPRPGGGGAWVIGRSRSADVPLDFDPYVSAENSRVVRGADGFFLEDVPTSRNGTHLNFEPLPSGGRAPLRHGDLVGVGRSLLAFRAS